MEMEMELVALALAAVVAVAVAHRVLGRPALRRHASRVHDWLFETTRTRGERPWRYCGLVGPDDVVVVATPALVEDITRAQHEAFGRASATCDVWAELIGARDGAAWYHQRNIAQRFFTPRALRKVALPVVRTHIARALVKLENAARENTPLNLSELLDAFALGSSAELAFGLDVDRVDPTSLERALTGAAEHVLGRKQKPTWLWKLQRWLNLGDERTYRQTTTFIRDFVSVAVRQSLARSRAEPSNDSEVDWSGATIVDLFINAARRRYEFQFSPSLLCDLATMFVLEGRDTTAATLNWFFYYLSNNVQVEQRIRQELLQNVPMLMDGSEDAISMEQAQTLVFLEAAITETLRLSPPKPLIVRQALRDAVLCDGTFVPKGMSMGISAYAMGRLTSVWGPDAAQYNPDRFLDEATGKLAPMSPFKFYGFGAGPRSCIGMRLAMLEMKMLVAALLSRFRLEIAPNDGDYKFAATLMMAQPLVATVAR